MINLRNLFRQGVRRFHQPMKYSDIFHLFSQNEYPSLKNYFGVNSANEIPDFGANNG